MVRSITLVAVSVSFLIGIAGLPARGDEPTAKPSEEKVASEDWLTFYYRKPQPDRFVDEVRNMSKAGVLTNEGSEPPTVAFLSRVMVANPDKIAAWMTALADVSDSNKDKLHRAIWLSDTKEGRAYLKEKGVKKYVEKAPPDILKMEIDSPDVLDMLWGYFFATGDEAPIRRLVSAFNYSKYFGAIQRFKTSKQTAEDKKNALNDAIFRAAMWSIGSNCKQHPRVKEHCEHLLKGNDLNPSEVRILKMVLGKTDPKKTPDDTEKTPKTGGQWLQNGKPTANKEWMKSNQGFGAQLLFVENPKKFVEDWNKPAEGVKVPVTDKAPRGKECGAFIIFIGCGEDEHGMADVVADMTLITPDGKTGAEQKGMEVWQKKPAPKEKQLQRSAGVLMIKIDADDPAGDYEIRAKVHDRVKGVVLELKRKFTVDK
jgi:hypothetical protein